MRVMHIFPDAQLPCLRTAKYMITNLAIALSHPLADERSLWKPERDFCWRQVVRQKDRLCGYSYVYETRVLTVHLGKSSGARTSFHPSKGGMDTRPEKSHTATIMMAALSGVRFFR